jgi:hypothetical protein
MGFRRDPVHISQQLAAARWRCAAAPGSGRRGVRDFRLKPTGRGDEGSSEDIVSFSMPVPGQ